MNRRSFMRLAAVSAAGIPFVTRGAEPQWRVGVIGHTGRGNYGHGLDVMWRLIPGASVVAVADADPKGLEDSLKRLGVERGFADYREMLAAARPDVVAVCPRQPDQHRDMILAAVEAGARGIYVEKPLCRTPAEADAILEACRKRNVKLAVAHRNRYHPVLDVVAKMVQDGAIGRLLEFRGRGKEDDRGGGEDLWVLGSHVLNLGHRVGGDPEACSAWLTAEGRPVARGDVKEGNEGLGPLAGDAVHARFDMACGVPMYFDSIRKAGTKQANFGLQIVGSNGIIDFRIDREPLAHWLEGNPFEPKTDPRAWVPISSAGPGKPERISDLKDEVAKHILPGRDLIAAITGDREPLCGAREGAMTVEMICSVFESHRQGGRRVGLPIGTRQNPLGLL